MKQKQLKWVFKKKKPLRSKKVVHVLMSTLLFSSVQANFENTRDGVNTVGALVVPQQQVSGTVVDGSGVPVPGVNILVAGTINGTQSAIL